MLVLSQKLDKAQNKKVNQTDLFVFLGCHWKKFLCAMAILKSSLFKRTLILYLSKFYTYLHHFYMYPANAITYLENLLF